MASFVFVVTTFQIWACHVMCVYKFAKNFLSQDTLLNFRKYELDTCTGSRATKNFWAPPPGGIGLRPFSTRWNFPRGATFSFV